MKLQSIIVATLLTGLASAGTYPIVDTGQIKATAKRLVKTPTTPPAPEEIEGTSLVPLLEGKPDKFARREDSLIFHYPHYGHGPAQNPQSAIIAKNYKLLGDLETGGVNLFDLEADLSEENDLSREMPEKAEQLGKLLDARLKQVDAQMPTQNLNYDPNGTSLRGFDRNAGRS